MKQQATNTHSVVTPDKIVEVTNLVSPTTEETPLECIKAFVRQLFDTNAFDQCFDTAYNLGMSSGTEAYDRMLSAIFKELDIEEVVIIEHLKSKGFKV